MMSPSVAEVGARPAGLGRAAAASNDGEVLPWSDVDPAFHDAGWRDYTMLLSGTSPALFDARPSPSREEFRPVLARLLANHLFSLASTWGRSISARRAPGVGRGSGGSRTPPSRWRPQPRRHRRDDRSALRSPALQPGARENLPHLPCRIQLGFNYAHDEFGFGLF